MAFKNTHCYVNIVIIYYVSCFVNLLESYLFLLMYYIYVFLRKTFDGL